MATRAGSTSAGQAAATAAVLPGNLKDAIASALAVKSTEFGNGLRITSSEFRPDRKLTAGLNKSTDGLTIDLADFLPGPLLLLLKSLTGDVTLLAIEASFAWTVSGGELAGRLLPAQQQGRPLGSSATPTFAVAFLPQLIERTKSVAKDEAQNKPRVARFTIGVQITLSVELLDQQIDAPPLKLAIPLDVPALPVPTLLGLFRHPHFAVTRDGKKGFLLLVVPIDSPFNVAGGAAADVVKNELSAISELATMLDRVLGFVKAVTGFALPNGLDQLAGALSNIASFALNGLQITADNPIDNLNTVTVIDNPFFFKFNDIEAMNEISSLIMIGPSGSSASLYRRKNRKTTGGVLNVNTASLVTTIKNLHARVPGSLPASGASVPKPDDVDWELWSNKHFGDSISSLNVRFADPAPARVVKAAATRPGGARARTRPHRVA